MRLLLSKPPFADRPTYTVQQPWINTPEWPASWLKAPEGWRAPWVAAFRCEFTLERRLRDHVHVTADERYELYLDGEWIGRGSQRGDKSHWFYESHRLDLGAGKHTLVACVWAMGSLAPWAQVSVEPGFFCCPESEELVGKLATGVGPWEVLPLPERTFSDMSAAAGTGVGIGPSEVFDAARSPWGWERGEGTGWSRAMVGAGGMHGQAPHSSRAVHWLLPATLPQQVREPWKKWRLARNDSAVVIDEAWQGLLARGRTLTIPAHTKLTLWLDPEDYVCFYPHLRWSGGGGATIKIGWAEALREAGSDHKVHGALPDDARFVGPKDEIRCDGGTNRWWRPLWWRCGNYVQVEIETREELLALERLELIETRYPLAIESRWIVPDPELERVLAISCRTLEMCMHETYMDCPYYEQLMYIGDTRLQCLLTYALGTDSRPQRTTLELYDSSRFNPSGQVVCAHPCGGGQLIPPFALWWVAMLHDFARWRGEIGFLRARLPGMRAVLDTFRQHVDAKGVLHGLNGWNFYDWTFQPGGIAPGGRPGERNAGLQAHWTLVLGQAAQLEAYAGEPELAARYRRWQRESRRALVNTFWDVRRNLFAETVPHAHYAEQTQCLALLAGVLSAWQRARVWKAFESADDLVRTSSYFAHYYFEACLAAGRMDLFERRLEPWRQGVRDGLRTTPETFGETRSECHAWSAHPLYHFLTGVLGIQPGGFGFRTVRIAPQLGLLPEASGELAHPLGPIRVKAWRDRDKLRAEVELPEGLGGVFVAGGRERQLRAGKQKIAG